MSNSTSSTSTIISTAQHKSWWPSLLTLTSYLSPSPQRSIYRWTLSLSSISKIWGYVLWPCYLFVDRKLCDQRDYHFFFHGVSFYLHTGFLVIPYVTKMKSSMCTFTTCQTIWRI
jgi:hypothetical protein